METTSPTSTQNHAVAPISVRRTRRSNRPRDFVFALVIVIHGILGLLWAGVVLAARSFRDCSWWGSGCDGVTGSEWAADLSVWAIGGGTWLALAYLFFRWMRSSRIYWGFLIAPVWTYAAVQFAAAVILS